MAHTFGHDKALLRGQINDAIFEIDQETAVQNEEELIDVLMLVPMVFALNHRHPNDRIVHPAERLVVPFIGAGVSQFLHIDYFKRSVQNVEVSLVREFFGALSRIHAANVTAEHTEVAEKTTRSWLCDLCVLNGEGSLFFAREIIGFPALYDDAICRR